MSTWLSDPFDDFLPRVHDAVMAAGRRWSETVLPEIFPSSLAAAADEGEPMDLQAILAAAGLWATLAEEELAPVIIALVAARTAEISDLRTIDLSPLARADNPPETFARALATARRLLSAWGVADEEVEVVITRQTWVDRVDGYARAAVNRVQGMPEATYRDLVGKLSTATKDGLGQFDRNLIVRDVLDMGREGGFEAWNTRADRIARTETNSLVNAGTLQAAVLEQAVTGTQLEKVWVSTMDRRTRDTHFAADGQRVPVDGVFRIGGYEAEHPGAGSLPARESVNCRCSLLLVEPDEPLPSEADRQTERERSDGTSRDPQAEVRERANRGVTRDRDDEAALTADGQEQTMRLNWSGVLAPLGAPSGDGRTIDADAGINFRDFPMPLMFQKEQSMGHDTSVIVGKITSATTDGTAINAAGELFDTPEAGEAAELLREEVIRPSVDLCDMVVDWQLVDGDGNKVDIEELDEWTEDLREEMHVREATIMGATLVAKPAFAEAKIVLGDEVEDPDASTEEEVNALQASALAAETQPALAFADPRLTGPTPLTVDGDGRVFGHLALWGTEHVGFPGKAITPPKSATNYSLFHVSQIETDQGALAVGRLTVGTGHAEAQAGVHAAAEHYDSTGTTWAFVRAGEDQYGIWIAGVVNPDADEAQVRAGAAAPLSGDWRRVGGSLELVAALSVNTPGFPVPRTFQSEEGLQQSIVAAAVVPRGSRFDEMVDAVRRGVALHEEEKAAREARLRRQSDARKMAAKVMSVQVGGR